MDKKWESLYDQSRERNFQGMIYRYVRCLRKSFSHLGLVWHVSQWASLFECFYKAKQWKVPMLRGFTGPFPGVFRQIPFKVSSGHVQILMGWDQIICFPPQASWRTPGTSLTSRGSWQKKSGLGHPTDLKPPPLNAGQVLCLDLCATLGVSDAPLLSYKVDKLKENMG